MHDEYGAMNTKERSAEVYFLEFLRVMEKTAAFGPPVYKK